GAGTPSPGSSRPPSCSSPNPPEPSTSWPTSHPPEWPPATWRSPSYASAASASPQGRPSARWPARRSGSASPARTPISERELGGWPNSYTRVRNPAPFVYPAEVDLGRNRSRLRFVWPDMQLLTPILTIAVRSLGPGRLRVVVVKLDQKHARPSTGR